MKIINSERGFTLIEMMIISNVQTQIVRNSRVYKRLKAVARNEKPQ